MSSKTLFQAVKEDHEEMYEYHDAYKRARGARDAAAQARWARQLTWEVARHAVGEELVVYPLMETHLGARGRELAEHDRAEHDRVKALLYRAEGLQPGTGEHDRVLEEVMTSLHHHNDDEEIDDLPWLERVIGEGPSREAALSFKKTKKLVPTRAHPGAPNKPPAETFAGFPTEEEIPGAKEELKHRDHDAAAGRAAAEGKQQL